MIAYYERRSSKTDLNNYLLCNIHWANVLIGHLEISIF